MTQIPTPPGNPLPEPCRDCLADSPRPPRSYARFLNDKGVRICAYVTDERLCPADEVYNTGHAVWHMVNATARWSLCKLRADVTDRCAWDVTGRLFLAPGRIAVERRVGPWPGAGHGPSGEDSQQFYVRSNGVSDVSTSCAFAPSRSARSPFKAWATGGPPPSLTAPAGPAPVGPSPSGPAPVGPLPSGPVPSGGPPDPAELYPWAARLTGTAPAVPTAGTAERVVVCVDLYRYRDISKHLAENEEAGRQGPAVLNLNKQIERLIRTALTTARIDPNGLPLEFAGDGAVMVMDRADQAHDFAQALHQAARHWNVQRQVPIAHRHFRIGIFMGEVILEAAPAPDGGFVRFRFAGTAIADAVRLEGACATGDVLIGPQAWGLLSRDRQPYYGQEEPVQVKHGEQILAKRWRAVVPPAADDPKAARGA